MENAKKFFEEVARTEEAKAFFKAAKAPETEEERVAAYIEIAKKLGIELTAEGIAAYYAAEDETGSAELDDKELSQLVGGGDNAACVDTFRHKENCWWNDGCDRSWNEYVGYQCSDKNSGNASAGSTNTRANELRQRISIQYYPICGSLSVNEQLEANNFK